MQTTLFTTLTRRKFLGCSLSAAGLTSLKIFGAVAPTQSKLRAAIIGATGRGNYGHDHDLIFNGRENVQVVAVADADEAGRLAAMQRTRALKAYADYREMLDKEKPELVCVAPRWTDQHHAMALAALRVGAHVYLEKPITRTLAEADELLTLAKQNSRKMVVAHQMRLAPNILELKARLDEGLIGDLLEIRAHGKQDQRAGGEDLIVLGVHLFDLMRFYAGDALWCSARVVEQGEEITPKHARAATENIGFVAGDDIVAQFSFARGVNGTFVSRKRNRDTAGPWGLELVGSQGRVRILTEMIPTIYLLKPGTWKNEAGTDQWRKWEQDPTLRFSDAERSMQAANQRVVEDWFGAIRRGEEPVCGGYPATKALEMAMAVFTAGLTKTRVSLPLQNRRHPLDP